MDGIREKHRLSERHACRIVSQPRGTQRYWSFDFVEAHTHDGRNLRILTLIDEHSRTCLALKVARGISSLGMIEALADAMLIHGVPSRSDPPEGCQRS